MNKTSREIVRETEVISGSVYPAGSTAMSRPSGSCLIQKIKAQKKTRMSRGRRRGEMRGGSSV